MRTRFVLATVFMLSLAPCGKSNKNRIRGAGGSLRFVGDERESTQKVISKAYDGNVFLQGLTVSMWYRPHVPWTDAGTSTSGGIGAFFSVQTTRDDYLEPLFSCFDYLYGLCEVNSLQLETQSWAVEGEDDLDWRFVWLSWDPKNNSIHFGRLDPTGRQVFDEYEVQSQEIVQIMEQSKIFFHLGESKAEFALNAEVDSFCVFSSALDKGTLLKVFQSGCEQDATTTLQLEFDDMEAIFMDSVTNEIAAVSLDQISSSSCSSNVTTVLEFFGSSNDAKGPYPVFQSSAPFSRGYPVVIRSAGENVSVAVPLVCEDCDDSAALNLVIQEAPQDGLLCVNSTSASDVSHVCSSGGSLSPPVSLTLADARHLMYVSTTTFNQVDRFQARLVYLNGTVNESQLPIIASVVVNTPPSVKNSTYIVHQGEYLTAWLPEAQELTTDPDSDSDFFSAQVIHIDPGCVQVYHCEECIDWEELTFADEDWDPQSSVPTNFPFTLSAPFRRLLTHKPIVDFICEKPTVIFYRLFDGLDYSDVATVTLSPVIGNFPPMIRSHSTEVEEDGFKSKDERGFPVNLTELISDIEGDSYAIQITSLPQQGELYQRSMTSEELVPITLFSGSVSFGQWVSETASDLDSGTEWEGYGVDRVRGLPDLFPRAEDVPLAWQPLNVDDLSRMWVILSFDTPVFPERLTLYETWTPNTLSRVEAEDYDHPDGWKVIFEDVQPQTGCPNGINKMCSRLSEYALCPMGFRSRRLRLFFKPSALQWVALDAARLTGSLTSGGGDVLRRSIDRLWYKPVENFFGQDSFSFTATDCPYYQKNRRAYSEAASVYNFKVRGVDDPPSIEIECPQRRDLAHPNCQVIDPVKVETIEIPFSIRDPDGMDPALHTVSAWILTPSLTHPSSLKFQKDTDTVQTANVWKSLSIVSDGKEVPLTEVSTKVAFDLSPSVENSTTSTNTAIYFQLLATPQKCAEKSNVQTIVMVSVKDAATGVEVTKEIAVTLHCSLHGFPSASVRKICLGAAWVNILLGGCSVVFSIIFRDHMVIKAAQVSFLICVCVGVMISSSTVFFLIRDDRLDGPYATESGGNAKADQACVMSLWTYTMGYLCIFLPLSAKMFRAKHIFRFEFYFKTAKEKARLRSIVLLKKILVIGFFEVLLVSMWTAFDPLVFQRFQMDSQPGQTYGYCDSSYAYNFLAAIAAYHLLVQGFLMWLCQKTIRVNTAFSEGKHLRIALAGSLEILLLSIPINFIMNTPESILYSRTAMITLADFSVLGAIMFPKIYMIKYGVDAQGDGADLLVDLQRRRRKVHVLSTAIVHSRDASSALN